MEKKYSDLTSVTVCGRLSADARKFKSKAGKSGIGYKVLASCGWGDKLATVAFDCVQWGDKLDGIAAYLTKGSAVTVSGRIDGVEQWESNGKSGIAIKVSVQGMQLGAEPKGKQDNDGLPPGLAKNEPMPAPDFDSDMETPF